MLASSFFDAMLGIDVHWEMVPMPAPVPTPIPNPFTGIVRDFTGLAAGLALSNAIGAVMGASLKGPVFYWGMIPATNTGTNGVHVPGHILIPPGTSWAPVPKTPKPVIRPNETPTPPKPASPDNDAIIVFGSKTVSVLGSNAVRMGDQAMSCSEPVRLPSTVVLAVPKGRPILIGGPPSLDIMAAVLASLRTRFVGDSLQALLSRMRPGRFRSLLQGAACFLTGHPVDVASGKMLTGMVDAELPGPLPLRIERVYQSNFASRSGVLGHGWSLSLDRAIWEERGKVVYLAEDGREIEFDTFDYPDHFMRVGDEARHPIDRLTLKREEDGKWSITSHDGIRSEFALVSGRNDGRLQIQRIVSRCGFHEITFTYDKRGRLELVRDCAGRRICVEQDERDRIVALKLPHPHKPGWNVHRRFQYDLEGDLVAVEDSLGKSWHFEYVTHLMVRETDRCGLAFYFEYDGLGEDAWCTRTWGNGGIYDHVLKYDKRAHVTYVTDSLGRTKQYHMNPFGSVVKIVDPANGTKIIEWNGNFQKVAEIYPLGSRWEFRYDQRGNLSTQVNPDGSSFTIEYEENGFLTRLAHSGGGVWKRTYDRHGRIATAVSPAGACTRYHYDGPDLNYIEENSGAKTHFHFDHQHLLIRAEDSAGRTWEWQRDHLGRVIKSRDSIEASVKRTLDTENRLLATAESNGELTTLDHDSEGRIVGIKAPGINARFEYAFQEYVSGMIVDDAQVLQSFDTEGRLLQCQAPNGCLLTFEYNQRGDISAIVGFDGVRREYSRDECGQVVAVKQDSVEQRTFSYDNCGRMLRVNERDGYFREFAYDSHGELSEAKTPLAVTRFQRDMAARVIKVWQDDQWISYQYDRSGNRLSTETSFGAHLAYEGDSIGGLRKITFRDRASRTWTCSFRASRNGLSEDWNLPNGLRILWERDNHGRLTEHRALINAQKVFEEVISWRSARQLAKVVRPNRTIEILEHGLESLMRSVGPNEISDSRYVDSNGNPFKTRDDRDRTFGNDGRPVSGEAARCEYDRCGNLIKKIDHGGREWSYQWTSAGYLAEVLTPLGERVSFAYDAFGRRLSKNVNGREVRWLWDGDTIIHEWEADFDDKPHCSSASMNRMSIEEPASRTDTGSDRHRSSLVTWLFLPGTFLPLVRDNGHGSPISMITDISGAPSAMYAAEEKRCWSTELTLSGKRFGTQESDEESFCPFRFPGQYEDKETGLYYNRYRYYDAELGTYISQDPFEIIRPASQYCYVPNPLTMMDPLGLAQSGDVWIRSPRQPDRFVGSFTYNANLGELGHFEQQATRAVLNDAGHLAALGRPGSVLVIACQGSASEFGSRVAGHMRGPIPSCPSCHPHLQEFADSFLGRRGQVIVRYYGKNPRRARLYRCGG